MDTALRRNFKVKGNISCIYKPNKTSHKKLIENIEVQLWHQGAFAKVFLGKGLTDSSGDFVVEFEVDSPVDYIVDGKISDVCLEAYYDGERLDEPKPDLLKGLVAYWKLDESTGTTALDATGNGYTGTLIGDTAPDWGTGKINNGLTFYGDLDGSNYSAMEIKTNSYHFDFGSGDFTYAFWMIVNNTSGDACLIDTDYDSPGGFRAQVSLPSGFKLYANGVGNIYGEEIPDDLTSWNHIVIRRIGFELEVFSNGISLGTSTYSGKISTQANWTIGSAIGSHSLDGKLDEIGIWNGHGLTNDEIQLLYNSNTGKQYPFQ